MRVEYFSERAKVFDEGETGDKFYIVLTGKVTVYKVVKSEIVTMILRRLVDLSVGDSFGELALESNQPRAATVIATMDSHLIVLRRD